MTKREQKRMLTNAELLQEAISQEKLVEFFYKGVHRIVLPHSWNQSGSVFYFRGAQMLRDRQDAGIRSQNTKPGTDSEDVAWRTYRLDRVETKMAIVDLDVHFPREEAV